MKEGGLAISEVARLAGVSASAIRYYEKEGLVRPPPRRGGRRSYDREVLDRLALIDLAKRAGFTIPEIRRLLAGFATSTPPAQRWRALTRAKLAELDARIEEAKRMRRVLNRVAACECPTFHDCVSVLRETRSSRR